MVMSLWPRFLAYTVWTVNLLCLVSLFAVSGPGLAVFRRCRTNQRFEMEHCSCNKQVIRIHSADVAFSEQCLTTEASCVRSTNHPDVMNCNEKRGCRFSPNVLDYPASDKLCDQHQNANFINITYKCDNGKTVYDTSFVQNEVISVFHFSANLFIRCVHCVSEKTLPLGYFCITGVKMNQF